MGHRINERNTGNWSLDGEPKNVRVKGKKVSRSFTESEIEMFNYLMNKIADNIQLDASDLDNQVYRDNGDILIQFSRDRMQEVRSLLNKFQLWLKRKKRKVVKGQMLVENQRLQNQQKRSAFVVRCQKLTN